MIEELSSKLIQTCARLSCQVLSKAEYLNQQFQPNERVVEYRFVFQSLLRTGPSTILDVGTGTSSLPHLLKICGFVVTAVDTIYDYWPKGMFNRHFYIINDDLTRTQLTETFDCITCISTLEHIENYKAAVQSMFALLNPGGHLVLTFPYNENEYIRNVYSLPGAGFGKHVPYICQVYSKNELEDWLKINGGTVLEQEYWQCFTGEYWTFGETIFPPHRVGKHEKHQLTCILIQKQR